MSDILQFKRGDIIVMTEGQYSDFNLAGFLVAVADLDLPALARQYATEERAKRAAEDANDLAEDIEAFPSWLIAKGHAMPVDAQTVHLGRYGDWMPEFGVTKFEYPDN